MKINMFLVVAFAVLGLYQFIIGEFEWGMILTLASFSWFNRYEIEQLKEESK